MKYARNRVLRCLAVSIGVYWESYKLVEEHSLCTKDKNRPFPPLPSVPVRFHHMRLSLRRVLRSVGGVETTDCNARFEVRVFSGGGRVAGGAVDHSSGPEVGVEGHGEEEGEGVEEVEVCCSSSMGESV
jgi:hypothetical protein